MATITLRSTLILAKFDLRFPFAIYFVHKVSLCKPAPEHEPKPDSCATNRLTNCYACWISRFAIGHAKRTPYTAAPSFLTPLSFPTWGYAPLNYSNPTYATRLLYFSLFADAADTAVLLAPAAGRLPN